MKLAPQCEFSHVNTPYKPIGLISKSLFCKLYNMKMLNFVFYEECKQAKTNFFSLSELVGYGPLEFNFIEKDSPTFGKVSG